MRLSADTLTRKASEKNGTGESRYRAKEVFPYLRLRRSEWADSRKEQNWIFRKRNSAHCPDVDRMKNEELVLDNMPLVWHIAKKYRNMGHEYDDLVQEGMIGLMKAAEKFDPDRGCRFSAFAGACIENDIRMYLRREKKHRCCVMSLDQKICEDGSRLEEVIGFQADGFECIWKQDLLERAAGTVGRKEWGLVRRYYLDGATQKELAKQYGIRQPQVSKELKRILAKMRRAAE